MNYNNIDDLETMIRYYSMKYYSGEPEISDEQFDILIDKLRQLNPSSDLLKTGWGFEVNGDKIKHKYGHIGSLDKVKSFIEMPDRFKDKTIYISPKLDGLSAVAYYEHGQLIKGITRGNGEYGKDITDKLVKIIGNQIQDSAFTGAVRGELIISDDNWKILQEKYNNLISPRNFAAGIINRKDIDEDLKYIDLVVYKIVGQENKPTYKNREEVLQWLKLNFKRYIPIYYYPVLNLSSWETYHKHTFDEFRKLGYALDGLVLTQPEIQYLAHWEDDHSLYDYEYDEIAFKFKSETATTKIKDIEWTLSRTNRMIPVAIIEPVELSGAIINRATCNNAKWVKELGLGKDAEVVITRSNEVIPMILEVIEQSNFGLPKYCPICNTELIWDGVDLKCNNKNCYNNKLSDLQQWCEKVGETDGLQWTLMKQYLDFYNVKDLFDLYSKQDYILNDLNSKKLSITELKIKDFFEKLFLQNIKVEKALEGLNINMLGEKTAKLMAEDKTLVYGLIAMSVIPDYEKSNIIKAKLFNVVKDAKTESILNNIDKFIFLNKLGIERLDFIEPISLETRFVAVTGSLETMKRKDFENFIGNYGYKLSGNLKVCEYLITNNPNSGSSKNKDAQKYGIKIITEREFLDLLK